MLLFYHYLFIDKKEMLSAYSQYPCALLQYNSETCIKRTVTEVPKFISLVYFK